MNKMYARYIRCVGLLCIAVFVLLLSQVTDGYSASYTVRGTLTREGHGLGEPPGSKGHVFEQEFEVSVEDCTWTIRTILVGNTSFSYFLSTFDGTNIVYMDRPSPASFEQLKNKILKQGATNLYQSAVVESAPVPRDMGLGANVYTWLAFASGCYFNNLTSNVAWDFYPIQKQLGAGLPFSEPRRQVPCRFTLASKPPYLPVRVEYVWTNSARINPKGEVVNIPLPAPFKGNFKAAEFKSESFTNVNGLSFPTAFEMKEYLPMPDADNETDFRCTLLIRGKVTSIAENTKQQLDDLKGQVISMNDYRFGTSAPVPSYLVNDGHVPQLTDPSLAAAKAHAQKIYQNYLGQKKGPTKPERTQSAARVWTTILLATVFVSPLIFFFRRRKRDAQN